MDRDLGVRNDTIISAGTFEKQKARKQRGNIFRLSAELLLSTMITAVNAAGSMLRS